MEDASDEELTLPSDTLAALQDFYDERAKKEEALQDFSSSVKQASSTGTLSMNMFTEDWNASQFWYSDETAVTLAKQLLESATQDTSIAVVSAPSVFIQLKNLLASSSTSPLNHPQVNLFEYDERFSVFAEFVHYDFSTPLKLPSELKGRFNRIICDPPFLSPDCQTKAAVTVRWLSTSSAAAKRENPRIIVCTGERLQDLVPKLYPGTRVTTFDPTHANGLGNEFRCYANYESGDWSWRESK